MVQLIVGLGNPGTHYAKTRHNAGAWFVEALSQQLQHTLRPNKRFQGDIAQVTIDNNTVYLLRPDTYMNHSGDAIQKVCAFYQISPRDIVVAHDDLDIPAGQVRFKSGGGHGGHNGLRSVMQHMGRDFHRLRIGIDHPGDKSQVEHYVLSPPSREQVKQMHQAIEEALDCVVYLAQGDFQKTMLRLHS